VLTNWAGNHRYVAASLGRPRSVAELQGVVARAVRVRALGSRHSFTDIADTEGSWSPSRAYRSTPCSMSQPRR